MPKVKSIKIVDNPTTNKSENTTQEKNTIEYGFEKSSNAISNVSKYASKNKSKLMCVTNSKRKKNSTNIKDIINNFNVSVLLAGEQNTRLHQ